MTSKKRQKADQRRREKFERVWGAGPGGVARFEAAKAADSERAAERVDELSRGYFMPDGRFVSQEEMHAPMAMFDSMSNPDEVSSDEDHLEVSIRAGAIVAGERAARSMAELRLQLADPLESDG